MGIWSLHWLEAAGTLQPWRTEIDTQISGARAAIAKHIAPPLLDVIVQRIPGRGIPEFGIGAHAHRSSCFSIDIDPDNQNFAAALRNRKVCSSAAHEANHCMRMAGPGLGLTLGEALVSEGLAGHFTQLVLGTTPAPWECAFGIDVLMRHFPSAEQLGSPGYSHRAWFFGVGGPYPRWLGYTLGHAIVEEWRLKCSPAVADLIHVPAADVLSAAVPRFANTERNQAH